MSAMVAWCGALLDTVPSGHLKQYSEHLHLALASLHGTPTASHPWPPHCGHAERGEREKGERRERGGEGERGERDECQKCKICMPPKTETPVKAQFFGCCIFPVFQG